MNEGTILPDGRRKFRRQDQWRAWASAQGFKVERKQAGRLLIAMHEGRDVGSYSYGSGYFKEG